MVRHQLQKHYHDDINVNEKLYKRLNAWKFKAKKLDKVKGITNSHDIQLNFNST